MAARPSLLGAAPLGSITSTAMATAAATVLAVIQVVMTEATSEVSLVAPSPSAVVEEERETRLPALPGEGSHGSPSLFELEVLGRDVVGTESKRLPMARETEVVEISSDDEAANEVELPVPSQELAVVQSEAWLSSRLEEIDLVWPCPEDPTKV